MIDIVSGMWGGGFKEYGVRFLRAYNQYFTKDFTLYPYVSVDKRIPNQRYIHEVPEVLEFEERHKHSKAIQGTQYINGWKEKDKRAGYCYRYDAYKFFRIPLLIKDASEKCRSDILVYTDSDSYAFNTVTEKFVRKLLPADKHVAYLGRVNMHSECGFLVFRLPEAQPLIDAWAAMYTSDKFIQEYEWHNSYLFDLLLQRMPEIKGHSMVEKGKGHVWFQSPLATCMDHIKGFKRKDLGYSPERYGKGFPS